MIDLYEYETKEAVGMIVRVWPLVGLAICYIPSPHTRKRSLILQQASFEGSKQSAGSRRDAMCGVSGQARPGQAIGRGTRGATVE